MSKVAMIVEYSIRTRVLVDADKDENIQQIQAMTKARNNILEDPESYLLWDNVIEIEEDEECPYDPEYDKEL